MTFEPQAVFFITSPETLKVLADERHIQLLQLMGERGYTIKELSNMLSIPATKLHYHVHLMEEHGLIVVTDDSSEVLEKTYRAVAKRYLLDESMTPLESTAPARELMLNAIDTAKAELHQNTDAILRQDPQGKRAEFAKGKLLLTKSQARELAQELNALWERYEHYSHADYPDQDAYTLLIAFFETSHVMPPNPPPEPIDTE